MQGERQRTYFVNKEFFGGYFLKTASCFSFHFFDNHLSLAVAENTLLVALAIFA